jgi:hypothetical protein
MHVIDRQKTITDSQTPCSPFTEDQLRTACTARHTAQTLASHARRRVFSPESASRVWPGGHECPCGAHLQGTVAYRSQVGFDGRKLTRFVNITSHSSHCMLAIVSPTLVCPYPRSATATLRYILAATGNVYCCCFGAAVAGTQKERSTHHHQRPRTCHICHMSHMHSMIFQKEVVRSILQVCDCVSLYTW